MAQHLRGRLRPRVLELANGRDQRTPERLADRARFGLGRTLALQGETEASLAAFRALVERGGPEWTDRAWLQIGQILAGSGQPARAVEAFETLERVAPRSLLVAESRLNRAEALLQLETLDAQQVKRIVAGLPADEPAAPPTSGTPEPTPPTPAREAGWAKPASLVPPLPPRPVTQE